MDRLGVLGVGLTVFTSLLTIWSYLFLMNIPLTALGIGLLILGISILLTPTHPIPPHAVRALLEGSTLNIEALLEELNITNRGYYVKGADGRVYVLIPIGRDTGPPIGELEIKGLVTKIQDGKYLTIIPPSSEIIYVQELSEAGFDDALNYIIVDLSELAESVETSTVGEYVVVKIRKPRGHVASWRFRNVLGSLEASIAASLLAKKYGVARIVDEVDMEGERIITLEVFQHG
jgi:hypothetical protein